MVLEKSNRLEHDFVVVIHLVASSTNTRLKDRAGVVVPLKTSIRLVPVDAPAKISRINVTGKPLLIAVQLVAHKVHLPCQGSDIAIEAQVVRVRQGVAGDLSGVIVRSNLHGQLARDHAHARGGTERGWTVR